MKKRDKSDLKWRLDMRITGYDKQIIREMKKKFDMKYTSDLIRFCLRVVYDMYLNNNSAVRFDEKNAKKWWKSAKNG